MHFDKVSKLQYSDGAVLTPSYSTYVSYGPAQAVPKIISSKSLGAANIEEIKSYFTDEQIIRKIAELTGMDFDVLVNGDYKLLIEPIVYVIYENVFMVMTATEAALYDEITGGAVRSKLPTVGFQNLPLAMFLELADLGYSAWDGPTTGVRSNQEIKSALGLGVITFQEKEEELEVSAYDYEYRVNTEVVTSVRVSGGKSDPDGSVKVTFKMDGKSYTVSNVYYPQGDSQVVWVRWTTPETPGTITIHVSVSGSKKVSQSVIIEIKSGYGINQTVQAEVRTNNFAAATSAQNAVTYFPEFQYEGFWRLLEPTTSGYHSVFEFKNNKYSTYNRRTHFTPIWMPDGTYTPYTWLIDSWTPAGMLSMNLTDSITIKGNLWMDWHISPQNPE